MIDYKFMLIDRIQSILYKATDAKSDNIVGWIGGNPPKYFDNFSISEEGLNNYTFYLTIQSPFDAEQSISIFIPIDYDYYSKYNIYPNIAIKAFEHKTTTESKLIDFRNPSMIKKKYIVELKICNTEDAVNDFYLIKFGGIPDLIQEKEHYYKALSDDDFGFLFQVDESGYPDDLIDGNTPFNFGSLYIYAKIGENSFSDLTVGFWQFS